MHGVVGDPQFVRIGELDHQLRNSGLGRAFAFWEIQRTYNEEELDHAELFLVKIPFTEISAEEYGTQYQDSSDCEPEIRVLEHVHEHEPDFRIVSKKVSCALHSKQLGPLRVAFHKLKANLDVYRFWGGEIVASERFVSLVHKGEFSGAAFFPVVDAKDEHLTSPFEFSNSPAGLEILSIAARQDMSPGNWDFWLWLNSEAQKPLVKKMRLQNKASIKGKVNQDHRRNLAQLVFGSKPIMVSQQSRFGETPFDTENSDYHRCDAGVIAGRRLISRLSVLRSSWDGSDLCRTDIYVGGQRQGLFRPHQLVVLSKALFQAVRKYEIKGIQFEVADVV
jgi:hypothetical protein